MEMKKFNPVESASNLLPGFCANDQFKNFEYNHNAC